MVLYFFLKYKYFRNGNLCPTPTSKLLLNRRIVSTFVLSSLCLDFINNSDHFVFEWSVILAFLTCDCSPYLPRKKLTTLMASFCCVCLLYWIYKCCIFSSWGCVGVGRLWDINRSWFQRPLLTRLYVRASIQLSLSHCSLVTGWSARPCDLSFWEILRQTALVMAFKSCLSRGRKDEAPCIRLMSCCLLCLSLEAIYGKLKVDVFSEESWNTLHMKSLDKIPTRIYINKRF